DIATPAWRAAPDDVARLGYAVAATLQGRCPYLGLERRRPRTAAKSKPHSPSPRAARAAAMASAASIWPRFALETPVTINGVSSARSAAATSAAAARHSAGTVPL